VYNFKDMKALQAIGITKALKFIYFGILTKLLHWVILPQTRGLILKIHGARIGTDTIIGDVTFANLYHYGFKRLVIGNRCFIGDEVMLDVRGGITLEDNVTLSNRTVIVTHINVGYPDHPLQKVYPTKEAGVIVRSGAYTGTGAMILPGITVGKQAVVGAGAVVTKDVPDKTVVAGVPAIKIKVHNSMSFRPIPT
jgi:acetyltransferase-like isoleucine patch superfamily enzyme